MNCQLQLDGCNGRAAHKHHRQTRSQLGGDEKANLLHLCAQCHGWIHAHPAESYENGWLVYSWQDPAKVDVFFPPERIEEDEWLKWRERWNKDDEEPNPIRTVILPGTPVEEGETCPVCLRRKPHAKKPSSPKTKVSSVRVPIDDVESFEEIVDAAAAHLGFKESPHWRYRTLLAGLVLALQEPADAA